MRRSLDAIFVMAFCFSASAAPAVESCRATINPRNGVVLVEANGVVGALRWGAEARKEFFPLFNNGGQCLMPGMPKKCELGPPQTMEQISPPETCTVHLKDTADGTTCAAYVRHCVPGRRPCPSDMITVGGICVDKYEATVWDSPTGGTQYGATSDDYPCDDDGQNCSRIYARSVPAVTPSRSITWFQAQQACANAGKRLPTNAEWQMAVAGTPDAGPDNGTTDCRTAGASVVDTGSRSACVSTAGAFDMVGNLSEWVADWVPASGTCPGWGAFSDDDMCLAGVNSTAPGPGALLRSGWFGDFSGAGPFQLIGHVLPSDSGVDIGFRCAR